MTSCSATTAGEARLVLRGRSAHLLISFTSGVRSNVSLEQLLAEKQAKVDSLQAEVKKARQQARRHQCSSNRVLIYPSNSNAACLRPSQVLEKDRFINFFGRDLHRIVVHTDPHLLREGIKAIYRTYVKRETVADEGTSEDMQVQAEFSQQRQYMERALQALKTSVGRTETQTRLDFREKVGENEKLICECNRLRKECKELNAQLIAARREQLQSVCSRPSTASAGSLPRPWSAASGMGCLPSSGSTSLPQ